MENFYDYDKNQSKPNSVMLLNGTEIVAIEASSDNIETDYQKNQSIHVINSEFSG